MKMVILIKLALAAFTVTAAGCATRGPEKYVGTWGGVSTKAKDGAMFRLEAGGGGYAATFVGAVPLKWRETDANHLDVRFSCGNGFLTFYDLVYLPRDKALSLLSQKTIHLRDGKVSKEHEFKDMVLSSSNEYTKAMAPLIEYAQKAREFHAKSDKARRPRHSDFITNRISVATWDDLSHLDKNLLGGWSVGLSAAERHVPSITISSWPKDGKGGFSIHGGRLAIGNPEDSCDFENSGQYGVNIPVEAVPPNATPMGEVWDAAAEADTLRRMRDKGWTVKRTVYYEAHFFYGIFRTHYAVQTGDMPADKLLGALRECFGGTLKPPIEVFLWKPKPHEAPPAKSKGT